MRVGLLLVLVCAVAGAPAAHGEPGPRLVLADRSPVVLVGTGFAAGESVTLTVRSPGRRVDRVVRASADGRFRTTIPKLGLTGSLRCASGVTIVAHAPRTGVVLWHPRALRDCAAPPLQPA